MLRIAMEKHWHRKFFFLYKFPQRLNWISVGRFYSNIVSARRERKIAIIKWSGF